MKLDLVVLLLHNGVSENILTMWTCRLDSLWNSFMPLNFNGRWLIRLIWGRYYMNRRLFWILGKSLHAWFGNGNICINFGRIRTRVWRNFCCLLIIMLHACNIYLSELLQNYSITIVNNDASICRFMCWHLLIQKDASFQSCLVGRNCKLGHLV